MMAVVISDAVILDSIIALYAYPGSAPVVWDHLDTGAHDDGIYWGAQRTAGVWVIINRGSVTLSDFERDLDATATNDPQLGGVHAGFMRGMRTQWGEVQALIGDAPWIAAGHSLGAARASLLAGLGTVNGRPPAAYVRFGEPRPGFQRLRDILAPVPGRSYRNSDAGGHDLVTDVPFDLPPAFPYVHPQPLIEVSASPPPGDNWGPFAYHHAYLYAEGLAKLSPSPGTAVTDHGG